MSTRLRLGAFAAAAAVVLGGGAAVGAAAGPAPMSATGAHGGHQESTMKAYRVDADTNVIAAGRAQRFGFRVLGPHNTPVNRFELRHERLLHLIVVSNDLTRYAHLHPALGKHGEWTVELPALSPGGYRVIADTSPRGGPALKLTFELLVPGAAAGTPLPAPASTVSVDGLDVALGLVRGADGLNADVTVRRAGAVVEPEPYLGARGHLVAIAADDLRYLHVHPDGERSSGPVSFAIAEPRAGRYRLFFDFSVGGKVRTAAFTVDITEADAAAARSAPGQGAHG